MYLIDTDPQFRIIPELLKNEINSKYYECLNAHAWFCEKWDKILLKICFFLKNLETFRNLPWRARIKFVENHCMEPFSHDLNCIYM